MKRCITLLAVLCLLSTVSAVAVSSKGAEPLRISQGKKVSLTDYLVPGKTVIFDFTSKYCGPCRIYDEPLNALHAKRDDLVVVKVDINRPDAQGIDWQSPVTGQYGLQSIPHFKVYGPDGKLIAEDKLTIGPDGSPLERDPAGRRLVDKMIKEAK